MTFQQTIQKFVNMEVDVGGKRVLNDQQASIFRSIISNYKQGGLDVVTGGAGTGKSTVVSAIKKYCDSKGISCVITASTGKAASGINGVTIHSFINLSMKENNDANSVDEALVLKRGEIEADIPQILIVDEFSQVGTQLLREIKKTGFPYIVFFGDAGQLPPVKQVAVDWVAEADHYYSLTKVMRAKDERLLKMFHDFRVHKEGTLENVKMQDYINGDNILEMDFADIDSMPRNTEVSFIGYRNKLVDMMANMLTHKKHNIYNLNLGVQVTAMVVEKEKDGTPIKDARGYFKRSFTNQRAKYNGEDVEIIKLDGTTQKLVKDGYAMHGKWKLKLSKKGIIITDSTAKILPYDMEPVADKYWLSFPTDEILEHTTLVAIDGDTFSLLWDDTQDEYNDMLEYYFSLLHPYLRKLQIVKKHYKGEHADLGALDYSIREAVKSHKNLKSFMVWYDSHEDTSFRKLRWKDFLNASSVVSARYSTARTVTKAQGLSIPCVILSEDSFYGASKAAQYVAVSRAKYGIIILKNLPEWK